MTLVLEYNTHAPGVTIDRIRGDFEAIWKKNVVECVRVRRTDSEAGDYFHDGESEGIVSTLVYLNVQGTQTDLYGREKAGLSTTGALFHAYARHFEDLKNLDVITYNGTKFLIKNLNKSIHGGLIGFIEFDMFRYDSVNS